jgi:hypothetical protein
MNFGKKEVMIVIAVAVGWYLMRKATEGMTWSSSTGETYRVSEQQRDMLAAQDAAFSGSAAYETAPFHGYGANARA